MGVSFRCALRAFGVGRHSGSLAEISVFQGVQLKGIGWARHIVSAHVRRCAAGSGCVGVGRDAEGCEIGLWLALQGRDGRELQRTAHALAVSEGSGVALQGDLLHVCTPDGRRKCTLIAPYENLVCVKSGIWTETLSPEPEHPLAFCSLYNRGNWRHLRRQRA